MLPQLIQTPEALLAGLKRQDSKNPLATCFGITTSGRPCRRSLATAVTKLNEAKVDDEESTVVTVIEENEFGSEVTAFFCWQHKDQAASYHTAKPKRVMALKTSSSLEDMLSNMGLEDDKDVQRGPRRPKRTEKPSSSRPPGQSEGIQEPKETVAGNRQRPPTKERIQHSNDENRQQKQQRSRDYTGRDRQRQRRRHKEPSFWTGLFSCFNDSDDMPRYDRPATRRPETTEAPQSSHEPRVSPNCRKDSKFDTAAPRAVSGRGSTSGVRLDVYRDRQDTPQQPGSCSHLQVPQQRPTMRETQSQPTVTRKPLADRPTEKNKRHISAEDRAPVASPNVVSAAAEVIPKHASLALASALMAEMAKISEDTREGYIYIYWLADANKAFSDGAGGSLLTAPPSPRRNSYASGASNQTILLKVGRAENVHRRLSQWNLQCGHKPLLVASHPRPEEGIKVRHLHRAERLIHTELKEMNVKFNCTACGKDHREWFEVRGREGVREVDRIVRKWVQWCNRQPDS